MAPLCFAPPATPRLQRRPRHSINHQTPRVVSLPLRRVRTIACVPSSDGNAKTTPTPALERDEATSTEASAHSAPQLSPDRAYFRDNEGKYQPMLAGAATLAVRNFSVEVRALIREVRRAFGVNGDSIRLSPPACLGLRLCNGRIAERERERERRDGKPDVWPPVRLAYATVCVGLDLIYDGRPIERFWVLETVARLPYLAYTSCLHLLSTLGWYRSTTLMSLHRAEDTNENFHLAVMESLGGDQRWLDRFVAFHVSLVYYWILVALFFISPKQSYGFSQLLEAHAVDTYGEFVEENEEQLKELPVPEVAHVYFNEFLFYYQEIQVRETYEGGKQRPVLNSLYDVFMNILEDEKEHSVAMEACGKYVETGEPVVYNGRKVRAMARGLERIAGDREEFWREWEKQHKNQREGQNGQSGQK